MNLIQKIISNILPPIPPSNSIRGIQERNSRNSIPIMAARNYFAYGLAIAEQLDPTFKPITAASQFVTPKIPYSLMIDAYETDSEIMFGLDWITSVSVGIGHYFTAVNSRVEEYVNKFAEDINLDSILTNSGRETLGYGDSIWRYKDISSDYNNFDLLEQMPLSSLKRIWWDNKTGEISHYELRGNTTLNLQPAEIIHFKWRTSNASPFGLGLLAPIVKRVAYTIYKNNKPEIRYRMSILDIKRSIQDSVHKAIKRYVPRNLYELTDATKPQREDAEKSLAELDDEQDFVVDGTAKVTEMGAKARVIDLDSFEQLYTNEIIKAIGTPVSRLYEKGALTEASSKTAKEVAMMNLAAYQRHRKREIERLIIRPWYMLNPVHDANGVVIPYKFASIRLNWGAMEKPELDKEVITAFVNLLTARPSLMDDEEIRDNLKDWNIKLKSPEQKAVEPKQPPLQQPTIKGDQPSNA